VAYAVRVTNGGLSPQSLTFSGGTLVAGPGVPTGTITIVPPPGVTCPGASSNGTIIVCSSTTVAAGATLTFDATETPPGGGFGRVEGIGRYFDQSNPTGGMCVWIDAAAVITAAPVLARFTTVILAVTLSIVGLAILRR